jgi:hypothetical protein
MAGHPRDGSSKATGSGAAPPALYGSTIAHALLLAVATSLSC